MEYNLNQQINSILLSAIRKVGNYVEGDTPGPDVISDAFDAFVKMMKHLERNKGLRLFKKVWRQHVFEESSKAYVATGINYRCIKSHTVPNTLAWVTKTIYSADDCVYPATYNGYYYQAINDGISGNTAPTFPTYQNDTVVDSGAFSTWQASTGFTSGDVISPTVANGYFFRCISSGTTDTAEPDWTSEEDTINDGSAIWVKYEHIVWRCIPDTKPGLGKNYRSYWVLDDSISDADASLWNVNSSFKSAGNFTLQEDELYITSAHIRYQNNSNMAMSIIDHKRFQEDINNKWNKGLPELMSIELIDLYTRQANVFPIPSQTGLDGYIMHYEVVLKTSSPVDQNQDMEYLDGWFRYLDFQLAADLAPEFSLPLQEKIYLDKKAAILFKECQPSDSEKVTERRVKPCF